MTVNENTNATAKRVFVTGARPENPIILDVVYLIDDIREEVTSPTFADAQNGEQNGEQVSEEQREQPKTYSYVVTGVLSLADYIRLMKSENDATIQELDGAIFELAAILAGGA